MESSETVSPPLRGPGQRLREARETAGISAREMADRLNWLPRHVAALEDDRFDELHGAAFVRGYLRAYARVVAVDEEEVVAAYDALQSDAKLNSDKVGTSTGSAITQKNSLSVVLGIGVAVLVVAGFWWQQAQETPAIVAPPAMQVETDVAEIDTPARFEAGGETAGEESGETADPQAGPSTEYPAALSPALSPAAGARSGAPESAAAPSTVGTAEALEAEAAEFGPASGEQALAGQAASSAETPTVSGFTGESDEVPGDDPGFSAELLEFSFSGDCWVEIRDGDNQLIYADLKTAGDTLELAGKPPFQILAGNASAVALRFRGEEVQVSTRPGRDTARFTVGEL